MQCTHHLFYSVRSSISRRGSSKITKVQNQQQLHHKQFCAQFTKVCKYLQPPVNFAVLPVMKDFLGPYPSAACFSMHFIQSLHFVFGKHFLKVQLKWAKSHMFSSTMIGINGINNINAGVNVYFLLLCLHSMEGGH